MAQKKQDRKIEDRVTLVEPKTVYLDDSGKQITESQYYKTIGSRQPSGGEEQISGTKPAAPTQTRAVYFAPKTVETLAEISAINKAKASEKESKKVEEVSAKEAELNKRGSKGFDTLEDLARFNEDKKALEYLEKLAQIDISNLDLMLEISEVSVNAEDFKKAYQWINKAISKSFKKLMSKILE